MSDEFNFYGEGTDDVKETKIKGITGDVTDFTYTNVSFPCLLFNDDFSCPKHKLTVIQNMVNSTVGTKDISIYFRDKGDLYKIGMIDGLQVSAFLEVVGEENVTGYFDEKTKLTNSMLYTLCSIG